ncbi:MAG: DUF1156 domain-containing protein [Deltaproteobacteria bacterium]|nr:DUF1156 domain-containing protein [Deltaproteobacteria bacterium]
MIPKDCKRLAEVDFPIAVVSKHSAREKSIRHGHPSTIHLWWARRPLAACRAMLLGLLLPDPADENCPDDFKHEARKLLPTLVGTIGPKDLDLRAALLKFIGDFANWDVASHPEYISVGRGLVKAAHPDETPLVVDPFAGGGAIPLEALRLGCDAFASDLNPVACLILKVMLEDIPRHGPELADELRRVGKEIKEKAEKELAEFYPKDPDGSTPIAYLWARTVRCEAPNCGAEIPLIRSFCLCKKSNRRRALRYKIVRPRGHVPRVEISIFAPESEKEVSGGTVTRAKATCLCCGTALPPERVRAQLAEQHGGANTIFDKKGNRTGGALLTAVVTISPSEAGRHYRLPVDRDYHAVWKAQKLLRSILDEWDRGGKNGLCPVPNEPLPPIGTLGFRVQRYGITDWGKFFSDRQEISMFVFGKLIGKQKKIGRPLSLALGKLADLSNVVCPWESNAECPRNVLSNGRVKPSWDFAEGVLTSDSSGSFEVCIDNLVAGIRSIGSIANTATVQQAAAQSSPLSDDSASIWFTDPPYYDAIPYAALSDMFFVWFKRCINDGSPFRDPWNPTNQLTPKELEIRFFWK